MSEFDDYCLLIQESMNGRGYDGFFPSARSSDAHQFEVMVLETELGDQGDEELAMEWAKALMEAHPRVFIAFRAAQEKVIVRELEDGRVIQQRDLHF